MSEGWRTAPTAAQHGLQYRPPHVMQHMRCTFDKAADIPLENILVVDDRTYSVVSCTSRKTYKTCFGGSTLADMPSCECMAWQRSHLPCKHMCAAMLHCSLTWDVFPVSYREDPILKVDIDCLGIKNSSANDSVVPVADDEVELSAPPPECVSSDIAGSSAASKTAVQKHASALRDVLKQLDNLSYVVQSSETLQEATRSAELIHSVLLGACPVSDGLLLEAEVSKPKLKAPRRKKRLLELPSVTAKKLRIGKCDL